MNGKVRGCTAAERPWMLKGAAGKLSEVHPGAAAPKLCRCWRSGALRLGVGWAIIQTEWNHGPRLCM